MPLLSCTIDVVTTYDGKKLFCAAQGNLTEPKQTFLCISGLGGGLSAWSFICEELFQKRQDIRCITLDMRGHSRSSHAFPKGEHDFIAVLAKDVQAICQFYKCENPIFVGHSLGGLVIQTYLNLQLTPLPQKTVLICAPLTTKVFPEIIGKWSYSLLSTWSNLFNRSYPAMSIQTHLSLLNSFDFSLLRISHDVLTTGVLSFLLYWMCVLSRKSVPVSVLKKSSIQLIFGTRDLILPRSKQNEICRLLPESSVSHIKTNHNAVVNEPAAVANILAKL